MCHKIGHFRVRFPGVGAVLEVSESNRRSLYNGSLFEHGFFQVLVKSGARGRGCEKRLFKKHQKEHVFHAFSGSGSFIRIRGPGVGARTGNDGSVRSPSGGVSRPLRTHPGAQDTWLSPRLFPQRDSRYNTLPDRQLRPLALEGQGTSRSEEQGL